MTNLFLRRRRAFPENVEEVECPDCGEQADVLSETGGVVWLCSHCRSMGYYEDGQGRVFPRAAYRNFAGEMTQP